MYPYLGRSGAMRAGRVSQAAEISCDKMHYYLIIFVFCRLFVSAPSSWGPLKRVPARFPYSTLRLTFFALSGQILG